MDEIEEMAELAKEVLSTKYHCILHGEVTRVTLRSCEAAGHDPDVPVGTMIEGIYCDACHMAFLDQKIGQVTVISVKDEETVAD